MSTFKIPVIAGLPSAEQVGDELRSYGFIVLPTPFRNQLKEVEDAVEAYLVDEGECALVNHRSAEVPDEGWAEYFVFGQHFELTSKETDDLARRALADWRAAGSADYHLARLK